jgi:tetratricopeptide (TPR) repeat protein
MLSMAASSTSSPPAAAALITARNPANMTPLEAAMMDGCNLLHAAVGAGDHEEAARLITDLAAMLDRYEAAGADDHPNADWAVPHQRALVLSAAGDAAAAIVYEEIALEHAGTARQREISLGNLSERCLRLGRLDEAVEFFFRARDNSPSSIPIMLTGAQALYLAGYRQQAEGIFRALLGRADLLSIGNDLTAYLEFESRLHAMRRDLPSLDALMERWESLRLSQEMACG